MIQRGATRAEIFTRTALVNKRLELAQAELAEGRVDAAIREAANIVTFVDAERPQVHYFLGLCGIASGNEELVVRKIRLLRLFDDQEWSRALADQWEQASK